MFKIYSLFCLSSVIVLTNTQTYVVPRGYNGDYYTRQIGAKRFRPEIKLYYETKCPDCKEFIANHLSYVVKNIGPFLDVYTYPYGKAQTILFNNGSVEFKCQNGPAEGYGNKLHACAIDTIPDGNQAILFNGCLMEEDRPGGGSNDASADQCGVIMHIDSDPIKWCAKSGRSAQLLSYYGRETQAVQPRSVPHVIINGAVWEGNIDNFMKDVCSTFINPPAQCRSFLQ